MIGRESAYWDKVARALTVRDDSLLDNWQKRRYLATFLMRCEWIGQTVLEIGVGFGVTAGMLSMCCGRKWDYIGIEMSPVFRKAALEHFGLNVVDGDVLHLPPGEFTRILALDSLEHVHPDERAQGYANIAAALTKGGLLFCNTPQSKSRHEEEFDYGFTLDDFAALERAGLRLSKYELYGIPYGEVLRQYVFAVLTK